MQFYRKAASFSDVTIQFAIHLGLIKQFSPAQARRLNRRQGASPNDNGHPSLVAITRGWSEISERQGVREPILRVEQKRLAANEFCSASLVPQLIVFDVFAGVRSS